MSNPVGPVPLTLVTGPANAEKAGFVLGAYRAALDARADSRGADVRRRRPLPPRAGGGRRGLRRARRGLLGADARDRAPGRGGGRPLSAWPASASPARRSLGSASRRSRRRRATPGFVQALLRLVAELEEQRIEPGRWWAAMRAWGEREPARAVYAEELAAAVRRLPRRAAGDRAAATASLHDQARARRAAPGARALGRDARASSTASTTSRRSSATRSRRWPSTPARAVTVVARLRARPRGVRRARRDLPGAHGARPRARRAAGARRALRAPRRCTRSSARCSRRPRAGAPDPGDALLLLEGGGERAELELVAAHVARLIAEQGFAPEDIAVVLREPREHASLLAQVFGALEVPFALERTIVAGHTALGRGLVALLRCALAGGSADDLLAWLRTPGKLARPGLADRLEQRARVEGARDGGRGARRCGRPTIPTSSCTSSTASPRRRGDPAALCRRLAAEAARCSPPRTAARRAVLAGPEALDARVAAALRSALGELERLAAVDRALVPAPGELARVLARPRGARPRRPAPRARGDHEPARAARAPRARGLPLRPARGRLPAPGHPEPFLGDDERRALNAASGLRLRLREDRLDAERYLLYAVGQPPDRAARAQLARGRRRGRAVRALAVRRRRPRLLRPRRRGARAAPAAGRGRLRGRARADRERGRARAPRGGAGRARARAGLAARRPRARARQRARDVVGVGAGGLRLAAR